MPTIKGKQRINHFTKNMSILDLNVLIQYCNGELDEAFQSYTFRELEFSLETDVALKLYSVVLRSIGQWLMHIYPKLCSILSLFGANGPEFCPLLSASR